MSITDILIDGLWSALFATAMSIRNSTPYKFILPTFICGVAGVLARDLSQNAGLSSNLATMVAAFVIVIVAGLFLRSQYVPPVVMICAILPLWASVAMFNMLNDIRKISTLSGEALNESAVNLTANTAIVLIITISIVVGFIAGLAILKFIYRKESLRTAVIDPKDNISFDID